MNDTTDAISNDGPQFSFHADFRALKWDYAKSGIMFVFMVWISIAMGFGTVGWVVAGIFAIAFAAYLGQTIWRHGLRIEMDETGVTTGWSSPLKPDAGITARTKRLDWSTLSDIKLRFFSRRPQSEQSGWMMVEIEGKSPDGNPTKLKFDGDHQAFQPVLRYAWSLAQQKGLPLDEPTLANLEATGIETTGGNPWTS